MNTPKRRRILLSSVLGPQASAIVTSDLGRDVVAIAYKGHAPKRADASGGATDLVSCGTRELHRGIFPYDPPWVLSRGDMDGLTGWEATFEEVCARHALPAAFTPQDASELYFRIANFWAHLISTSNVTHVLTGRIPHQPADIALYAVAELRGVPFVYLDNELILNRWYGIDVSIARRFAVPGFDEPTAEGRRALEERFDAYVANLRADPGAERPYYMADAEHRAAGRTILAKETLRFLRRVVGALVLWQYRELRRAASRGRKDPGANHEILKVNRRRWSDRRSTASHLGYALRSTRYRIAVEWRLLAYRRRCTDLAALPRFVYFASHMQPEASTLPGARTQRHMRIAVDRLVAALPDDVVVAYKENPMVLRAGGIAKYHWKPPSYVDELLDNPRVVVVRDDIDTFELIDRSIGVATVNGTVAMEAVARGRHAITFSEMWYDGVDGIHRIDDPAQLSGAVSTMLGGVSPDPRASQLTFRMPLIDREVRQLESQQAVDAFAHTIERVLDRVDAVLPQRFGDGTRAVAHG